MDKYGFGLDVGGTSCKCGLFAGRGELLEKWEVPTNNAKDENGVLRGVAESVLEKMRQRGIAIDDVAGAGICVPGPVTDDGVVHKAANLPFGVFNIREDFSKMLGGIRVKAGNDANVAALGEALHGSGAEYDSIVMVTLGTGVGGGVVINGNVVAGYTGAGGEIGHIRIRYDETEVCGCGKCGCLEQYCSATGFVRVAGQHLKNYIGDTALKAVPLLDAKAIFDCAKAGDQLAKDIVKECCSYLAQGFQVISCVVNPQAFVIGGGVSKAGQYLIDETKRQFKKIAFHSCKDTEIVLASLGNDAGIYGAVGMVM